MALDLNTTPHDEFLPDLNQPLDEDELLQQHHGGEFAGGQIQLMSIDEDEVLPDLNKPLHDEEFLRTYHDLDGGEFATGQRELISTFEGGEALPDLNEQPANEQDFLQLHDAQPGISLVDDGDFEASDDELPAIVARWPKEDAGKTIWIQQDNARTHVPVDDEQFACAVAQTGLDIRLLNQPANSPDMNVLDLGFFASLQSFTYTTNSRNMDELIANVEKEYHNYDPNNLRNVFLTLQGCLIEVMKAGGGNKYKIPHMNKDRLEAMGVLPKCLNCDLQLYKSVKESLGV